MPTTTTVSCPCCGGTPCASGKKCFRQYGVDYNCDTDSFGGGAWTVIATKCLPIDTNTSLESAANGDPDFPCTLTKWVPSTTCCTSDGDCGGATFTPPTLPTHSEASDCCCCPCGDDCTGCSATYTVTIAGTGGAYDGGGTHFDGTFTLRACSVPRAAGDPCVDTLPACQWFLDTSFETGGVPSGNNDIAIDCEFGGNWTINFGSCKAVRKACCPFLACPPTGAYLVDCPGVTVSLS